MSEEQISAAQEYGADQIQILEGLEAVRKRPGMYIGSTSSKGLHHLVYEIVDNAVDEALAGFCDTVKVYINEDNSITVRDNGRGIPVGINKKKGIPAVEVVFTILHAGGKFGGGGYKATSTDRLESFSPSTAFQRLFFRSSGSRACPRMPKPCMVSCWTA